MMQYAVHPLCEMFPEMNDADYARLRDSIKQRGLEHPITLHEGKILDGRHRYRACTELSIAPRFVEFSGSDAAGWVVSENLTRRHLTPSQIAMVALRYEALVANPVGRPSKNSTHVGGIYEPGETHVLLGRKFGVGKNTVSRASTVKKRGCAQLVAKVESGEITVNEGVRIAKLEKDAQRKYLDMPKAERARKLMKATAISRSRKNHGSSPTVVPKAGTEFTRAFLGRIELIANDLRSRGLRDPRLAAERFVSEFSWDDDVQTAQLEHCMDAMRMIGDIYRIARERRAAA